MVRSAGANAQLMAKEVCTASVCLPADCAEYISAAALPSVWFGNDDHENITWAKQEETAGSAFVRLPAAVPMNPNDQWRQRIKLLSDVSVLLPRGANSLYGVKTHTTTEKASTKLIVKRRK